MVVAARVVTKLRHEVVGGRNMTWASCVSEEAREIKGTQKK